MEKLWTTAEVARYLGLTEQDVDALVQAGRLTGYRLAGQFMRFKPEQVKALKPQIEPRGPAAMTQAGAIAAVSWPARAREFFYFYDFYLFSGGLLMVLVGYLIWSR